MKWLATLLLLLAATPVLAQNTSIPSKIEDLKRLLQDAEVHQWIETQTPPEAQTVTFSPAVLEASSDNLALKLATWETRTRNHIDAVISAMPRIPAELGKIAVRLHDDAIANGYAPLSIILAAFGLAGVLAEWIFRMRWGSHGGGVEEFVPTAIFAAVMTMFFFAIEWPPLVRVVIACYLSAFVLYRLFSAVVRLTAHPEVHQRLRLIAGLLLMAVASTVATTILHIDQHALYAIAYLVSSVILALAIELVWSKLRFGVAVKTVLTFYVAGVWLLWCLDLKESFWLGIYIVALPTILRAIAHAVRERVTTHLDIPPSDNRNVLAVRGSRAVVIGIALAWIVLIWETDGNSIGHGDPRIAAVFYGILKSIVVLLLADLAWHLAKAALDRNFPGAGPAGTEAGDNGPEGHASRLCTVLPILRNVLAVTLFLVAGLIVLSQLGVDIGPLIAGAGIVGVAIGFGSQTLVKDVINGFFYLFDDAFRVGEYIQAKNYKGTVEGFSLRSVRLRHSHGPIFTIPFGELGAVENMSRDWSKMKLLVTVPYDTDLVQARQIGKSIGQELLDDPELGPLFIQPLKMKGVEEFGEYGIIISFAMITLPTSQQSFIRRVAQGKLREAFQKNGIAFAQPTIQVGGDRSLQAAAAALHYHSVEAKVTAEG